MKNAYRMIALLALSCPLAVSAQSAREAVLSAEKEMDEKASQGQSPAVFQTYATAETISLEAGQPQSALSVWRNRPAVPTASQNRYPALADVAQSGELAYTTGPFTLNEKNRTVAAGEFITIWRKNSSGEWKMAVNTGVDHARTTSAPPTTVLQPKEFVAQATPVPVPAEVVLELDKKFAQAELHAPLKTYEQYLSAETRLYRPGQLPLLGSTAHQTIIDNSRAYLFVPTNGYLAASGDLGYVYGSLRRPAADPKQPEETGTYLRVWRREATGGWRIVLEVLNAAHQVPATPATASNG